MIAYKGPGFYKWSGERVCSLHPESMIAFIDNDIDKYVLIEDSSDYKMLEEDIQIEEENARLDEEEQQRRDEKNELYGPRKQYQLDLGS